MFDFKFDGGGFGKGGTGTLIVDGKEVDKKHMENTVPFIFQWDESFDVGLDTGTPVAFLEYRYDVPFRASRSGSSLRSPTWSTAMPSRC